MEFLFIQKGHQARGVEQYAKIVRGFFAWLPSAGYPGDPRGVTRDMIDAWQRALFFDMGNVSNRSRASKLSALRSFFSWMKYDERRGDDPTKGIPTPRIQQSLPQKFSTEELRLLFAAPDQSTLMGLRDLAILKTLYAAGPRVSELVNLDLNHVTDTGGYIRLQFRGAKGNKDRTITLRRNPSKALREWIVARQGMETEHLALFVRLKGKVHTRLSTDSAQDILSKYARIVGIDDAEVFAHKMRSTFASDLYDSGDECCPRCGAKINHVDLLTVSIALNHADPKTTVPYIAVSDRHLRRTAIPDKRYSEIEEG
jgi:site-specific recombinase XerD